MHREISAFPNSCFYNGQLKDAPFVTSRSQGASTGLFNKGLTEKIMTDARFMWLQNYSFLDVLGSESGGRNGRSISNTAEATAVAALVRFLLVNMESRPAEKDGAKKDDAKKDDAKKAGAKKVGAKKDGRQNDNKLIYVTGEAGFENGGESSNDVFVSTSVSTSASTSVSTSVSTSASDRSPQTMVVITFYSAQVACLQQELLSGGVDSHTVRVLTVDSFQGSEADIVILSFVRSNSENRVGFVQDFQRLNVALTRAKHLLLAVGSAHTLQNSNVTFLNQLIVDAKLRNKLFDFNELILS